MSCSGGQYLTAILPARAILCRPALVSGEGRFGLCVHVRDGRGRDVTRGTRVLM